MSSTGWSPLPFALRYAQLARKKQQELELQMSQDIIELFQRSTQTINYPETAIPTLPIIREQKHKLNKKRQLFPPPPESGLHAYTQVLWPPDRKRRKRNRKRKKNHPLQKSLIKINRKTKISTKRESDFLWLPYFRKLNSEQFSEIGEHAVHAEELYNAYVQNHSFAFNNCGIYYIEGSLLNRKFYGCALDLDQARHRLIDIMRKGVSPSRLQEIYNSTVDEKNISFHVVERVSPFYKKEVDTGVGQIITIKTSRSFKEYRSILWNKLKSWILKVNIDRVRKSIMFPVVWKIWTLHVQQENEERIQGALRIQVAWRRRQGNLALHLKRQAKKHAKAQLKLENEAAQKLQSWWVGVSGSFARKMKERAAVRLKLEEEEMQMMARRIQAAWRKKKGGMAAHLKRQALREAEKERALELAAAMKIHRWWSQINGSFARKMKERAAVRLKQEKEENNNAARRIQHWWSMMSGSFAAKMKGRAEVLLKQEEEEMNRAALRIQVAWRKRSGQFGKHMKRQAQKYADERAAFELSVVLKLQVKYRRKHGKLAYHIASIARREARKEKRRLEQAAIYIQYRWRVFKGLLAQHLIRQARKLIKRRRIKRKTEKLFYEYTETRASVWNDLMWNEMQDPILTDESQLWEKCWDDYYQCEYWYNRETKESTWEDPNGSGSTATVTQYHQESYTYDYYNTYRRY